MPKTRAQIQFKVLAILTGAGVGQNPSPDDADAINNYIDAEVGELNADGSVYIADPDNLDDGLFLTFCKLIANAAADEFGGKADETKALQLRNRLRALARPEPGYGPQQVEYF